MLAMLGRSSKVVFAMMSFSLKLPVSMRATANESAGSSFESVKRITCSAFRSSAR